MKNNFEKNIIKSSQLLQASNIFQWTFSMMGLSLPQPLTINCNESHQRQTKLVWFCFSMHSILLLLAVTWMVYINIVIVDVVVESHDLDSITSVLSLSINVTVAFVQAIMQMVVFVKQKNYKQLIKGIAELERDLLLYYEEFEWLQNDINLNLNFQQRCQHFHHFIQCRYGLFSFTFMIFVSYINYHLIAEMMTFRDKFLTIFCTSALQFKGVEFCLYVQIIYEFISAMQDFLKCLKYEIAKSHDKCYMSFLFQRKLMANQFLINRIWLLVRRIEEYFSVPMLVLFLYNGIAITHTINWSYVSSFYYLQSDGYGMYRLTYIMLIFFIMFTPCWLTHSCIEKYQKFGAILHNIKVNDDLTLSYRIREYSLQLQHQEILFTCAGFFDINLKYFGLMILSISTYVGILIQFKLQKESEKANVRL